MPETTAIVAKQALELEWHEKHADQGDDEQISRYKRLVLERMRERQWVLLGDLTDKRVLDVGCGVGRETVELARRGASVVAVDLSPTLVGAARKRAEDAGFAGRVEFKVCAAEDLADHGDQFDIVLGNGVLHHLDLSAFKATLVRLLKPGAVAQFSEPLGHNPLLRLYRRLTPGLHSPTERPLIATDIAEFVEGFGSVRVEYFNFVGLALLAAPYVLGGRAASALLRLALRWDRTILKERPALQRLCQYVIVQVGAPA
jgi:2-polyprenyl-3-methyl-5-hydroxy-6-metoxy-1,4-benzoquinol methylase